MLPLSFAAGRPSGTLIRIPVICAAWITGAVARRRLRGDTLSERPPEPIHLPDADRRLTVSGSLCRASRQATLLHHWFVPCTLPHRNHPVKPRIVFFVYLASGSGCLTLPASVQDPHDGVCFVGQGEPVFGQVGDHTAGAVFPVRHHQDIAV